MSETIQVGDLCPKCDTGCYKCDGEIRVCWGPVPCPDKKYAENGLSCLVSHSGLRCPKCGERYDS
jgi:hypothetical protein